MELGYNLLVDGAIFNSNRREQIKCTFESINSCPICQTATIVSPVFNDLRYVSDVLSNCHFYQLHSFYICPICNEAYYARYIAHSKLYNNLVFNKPIEVQPHTREKLAFTKEINALSPDFVEIYNQAFIAEQQGLNRICGVGYRKALEFLVKDYAISKFPEQKELIENMNSIANVINKYIDFPQAKTVLERAVWLGNDQTHYKQKHTTKDLNDLKLLISLSVTWINATLETEKAGYEIPRK